MLQSSMWSQLARLIKFHSLPSGQRTYVSSTDLGPMAALLDGSQEELKYLKEFSNHYMDKGKRSIALAATLLQQGEIIAIPTDTIYGLAGLLSDNNSFKKLYEIKDRNENKPLSISIHSVSNIKLWGITDHLPQNLLESILPGPYTIILKRTEKLNPAFNPNHDTVGIRVPNYKFINCIAKLVGPLALTSANMSNEPNCICAAEFKHLWPKLGGIFYPYASLAKPKNYSKTGSTIIDLSEPGYFKIVRSGIEVQKVSAYLHRKGLQEIKEGH